MINTITIENREVKLTNLEKIYWPELDLVKGDLINYYIEISSYMLPHIINRPFSMKPFPEGIHGQTFYQKEVPKEAPPWLATTPIPSRGRGFVNWGLINDLPSLVWFANRGCIEMHTWFSRLPNLSMPDVAVLDIDPSQGSSFESVVEIAQLFHQLLQELGLTGLPKTSGMSGLHIYIPIKPIYPFTKVREFLLKLCQMVEQVVPAIATLERNVAKRGTKIYLDAVQNASAKTIPAPYSLRPSPEATVSTPLR
ncbi:MAG: non-homologous end-joining DNA ligase, partial [Bacillota bacterium]|nr:non-homologous end-joining DNA ligase [Bacillota bacterium]